MKNSDFISHKEEYIRSCKEFIADDGVCEFIQCVSCPFNSSNSINELECEYNGYRSYNAPEDPCEILVKSAKEYLKLYIKTPQVKYHIVENTLIYDRNIIIVE